MKKFLFALFAVLFCVGTASAFIDKYTINRSELPEESQAFLDKYFSKAKISMIKVDRHLLRKKNSLRVRRVMLLGGGRISYYLAKMLVPMGIRVNMIEINERKATLLSEMLPDVKMIYGDGTDQELLDQEGLRDMDAFVTLSDRDEENLMTGLFAVRQGVPKVIVKNNRVAYAGIINSLGLDSVVSPKSITCANILRYVRGRVNSEGTKVERLYRLMDGKAEALEFIARPGDPYIRHSRMDFVAGRCRRSLADFFLHLGGISSPLILHHTTDEVAWLRQER